MNILAHLLSTACLFIRIVAGPLLSFEILCFSYCVNRVDSPETVYQQDDALGTSDDRVEEEEDDYFSEGQTDAFNATTDDDEPTGKRKEHFKFVIIVDDVTLNGGPFTSSACAGEHE